MASQTEKGKAFEYACLKALYERLSQDQNIEIIQDTAFFKAQAFYEILVSDRQNMDLAGQASVRILTRLEPRLLDSSNAPLYLAIQGDDKGQVGDVRDILCLRRQHEWEIGISCKHNHTAVKHPRLSSTIDFGLGWFNQPCSEQYFDEISPVFDELSALKEQKALWREIKHKEERFYIPILKSFEDELKRLYQANPALIAQGLIAYMLGRNDFYKVIADTKRHVTEIQGFNLYGTLNQSAGKNKPISTVPITKPPDVILDIKWVNKNKLIVTCDSGWAISLRIHSAKSSVEPSLKFDAQLIGVPSSLMKLQELW